MKKNFFSVFSPGETRAVEVPRSVVDSQLGGKNNAAPLSLLQPTTNQLGLSFFGQDIWKCLRGIKHKFGLWSFVGENGPKNLFRCSPRVAVCRVYKVTTSFHKSVKYATISTIFSSLFRTKCRKLLQNWFSVYCINISILAILLQNVKVGDIWIFVLGLFYNKVWLRGEECFL